jgi:threonine dehydrogenase-like Zn-dependent dehydrogenase
MRTFSKARPMQQLTYVSPRRLEWHEVPTPTLVSDTDALVRPLAVARCDLDLAIAHGHDAFPGPFAMGHEAIGLVTDAGDRAGVAPGERVVVPFQLSCGRCGQCRRGFTNSCEAFPHRAAYGLKPSCGTDFGGALADRIRVRFADHMLVKLPEGLDPVALASVADNIPDGWRAVAPHLKARPGAGVLVIGGQTRSVTLYAAGLAASLGAGEVLFLDDDPGRRAVAQALGAHAEPLALAGRRPLKYEITVLGLDSEAALRFAIASTLPNGILTIVGMFFADPAIPLRAMYARGITLHTGRVQARAELPQVLAHCAQGHFHPERVTSRVVPFADAAEAMLDPGPKIIFTNDRP